MLYGVPDFGARGAGRRSGVGRVLPLTVSARAGANRGEPRRSRIQIAHELRTFIRHPSFLLVFWSLHSVVYRSPVLISRIGDVVKQEEARLPRGQSDRWRRRRHDGG